MSGGLSEKDLAQLRLEFIEKGLGLKPGTLSRPEGRSAAEPDAAIRAGIEKGLGLKPGTLAQQEVVALVGEVGRLTVELSEQAASRARLEANLGLPPGTLSKAKP